MGTSSCPFSWHPGAQTLAAGPLCPASPGGEESCAVWPVRLAALECCRTGQEKGIPGALGRVHGGVKGTQRQAPGKMGSQTMWDHHGLQPFFHRKGRQEKACSGRKPFSPGPINMNCKRKLARVKASTSPHFLCVKNQERSGGRRSTVCLSLSAPGRRGFPKMTSVPLLQGLYGPHSPEEQALSCAPG